MMPLFQSTHPVWGGTKMANNSCLWYTISIHPPRVGWDVDAPTGGGEEWISIHPPRVGWDLSIPPQEMLMPRFQSTHPVWGGTSPCCSGTDGCYISIHPPRVGWDIFSAEGCGVPIISIHPPRVGWDECVQRQSAEVEISIHPPRVGWDCPLLASLSRLPNFNPPTPCGVGLLSCLLNLPGQTFQSTHPVWGGTPRPLFSLCIEAISIHPPRVGWDGVPSYA